MKSFLLLLSVSLSLVLSAKEFSSKKNGWSLCLPDDWNSNPLLSSLIAKTMGSGEGAVETELTAFKGSGIDHAVILNLMSFETEASLLFNANAVEDALSKGSGIKKIRRKKLKTGNLDTICFEYIREPDHQIIQYLIVNKGRLWSLFFICPRDPGENIKAEIRKIAGSFRLEERTAQ